MAVWAYNPRVLLIFCWRIAFKIIELLIWYSLGWQYISHILHAGPRLLLLLVWLTWFLGGLYTYDVGDCDPRFHPLLTTAVTSPRCFLFYLGTE
jgi:hypothetical protein